MRDYNLLEELYRYHVGISNLTLSFGLCLTSNGGNLILGNIDQSMTKDESATVKFDSTSNLYSMTARALLFGDYRVDIREGDLGSMKVFIDSGATFSYFPAAYYNQIAMQAVNIAS
jgi:hypothetical protein